MVLLKLCIQEDINVLKSIREQWLEKLKITEISLFYFNSIIAFFLIIKIVLTSWWKHLRREGTQNLSLHILNEIKQRK